MASGKIGHTFQKLELVEGNTHTHTHTKHGDVANLIFLALDTTETLPACIVRYSCSAHGLVGEMTKCMEFSKSYLRTLHSMLTNPSLFFDQYVLYSVCLRTFTTTES